MVGYRTILRVHLSDPKNRSGTAHKSVQLDWEMPTLQITDGRAQRLGLS